MKTPTLIRHAVFALLFLSTFNSQLSTLFAQGILTPPGPPAPTMKTLAQVEARIIVNAANTPGDATNTFIISAPGSYYLTGNITGAPGKHGISIRTNDVTLDLNGFTLIGGGSGTVRGIDIPLVQTGLSIRNGNISGWSGDGVHGQLGTMRAEKLNLSNNTGIGLAVSNGSLVKDCVASGNTTGFFSDDRAQFNNCISTVNSDDGFLCTSFVTLIDCTSSRNGLTGIAVLASCSVTRCNATRNNSGGIDAYSGCTIADCTAGDNSNYGINVGADTTVRNCTVRGTAFAFGHGILCYSRCHVTGNTCDANYGGILVSGSGSRIEGNSCSANSNNGFEAVGVNNLFIRNSAHANGVSNYLIGTQNPAGPIVNVYFGGDISTVPNANHPWANFSY